MTDLPAVQNLLASWWFDYDQGSFEQWPEYFTADAHFSCRSDSGTTAFEEFIRADVTGSSELLRWQEAHRRASPYPLRHHATDVHVTEKRGREADFRSYLFVTQILDGAVSNVSTGIVTGTVRGDDDGRLRIADLRVVLDFTDSVVFEEATRYELA